LGGLPVDEAILVTGATGRLGRRVAERLLATGREVRMLSRHPPPAGDHDRYVWLAGDLRTGEGIGAAAAGVDTIVHCATTNGRGDVAMARQLIKSARGSGAPHLIYTSIVGVDRLPFGYYRAKLEAERLIEDSGLPWTILRTTQFHDLILWLADVQRRLPVALALSGTGFQPIDAGEVADRLIELVAAGPAGRVPDMGGPQVRGASDLTRACLRAARRRRPVLALWLPGRLFAGLRQGAHLVPERAVGRITFDEFLAERGTSGSDSGDGPATHRHR
jgi:uncharacterized protein YbjT (DUF2867 family)